MNVIKNGLIAIFAFFAFGSIAQAQDALSDEDATAFTQALVSSLQTVASNADASEEERVSGLRAVLLEDMATSLMGRFILGSTGREMATEEQLVQYNEIFPTFIATSFATEIDELASREINVTNIVRRRDNEVIVQSELIGDSGRAAANVDWRVRSIEGRPLLLDVLVERVSPMVTKREEITAILNERGMQAVLDYMQGVIDRS